MGKNIVVFSDGTGQDGGTRHNTNVYKLFNLILDRSRRQVSFYDRGLALEGWCAPIILPAAQPGDSS